MSAAIATHRAEQVADETKATDAGQRYAQSLFELTIESNQLAQVEADLKALRAMAAESADLRRLIDSPAFSSEMGRSCDSLAAKCFAALGTTRIERAYRSARYVT